MLGVTMIIHVLITENKHVHTVFKYLRLIHLIASDDIISRRQNEYHFKSKKKKKKVKKSSRFVLSKPPVNICVCQSKGKAIKAAGNDGRKTISATQKN